MKRRLWAPIVAVALAAVILVPSTFAVHTPSPTLYAQLGPNRFPSGQGTADASLQFNGNRNVVFRIAITGPAGTVNAVRVYVDGTCTNPGIWVINRASNAGPNGPFIQVASNSGVNTIQVHPLDVDRIAAELAGNPNETFALLVARVINGVNYRTCTQFRTTPFPPITTSTTSATTSATGTATSFTTRTITTTVGTQVVTLTLTQPVTTPATTIGATTTRTSTGFSTGTNVTTITSVGATTFTVNPVTVTSLSTGFTTLTQATTTVTSPVTTITNVSTAAGGTGTATVTNVQTVTNTVTVPVTTVTLAL